MAEHKTSYHQIMKATSIFGGVQVFMIIIGIIRSKFIATLLGPFGMGIAGLLVSTTGFVSALTNFGLSTSAVKDIASAHSAQDDIRVSTIAIVLKRWIWITGLFGAALTAILSPWLSYITFGNHDYTVAFVWLSISLLLNQIASGKNVLLQGMRQIGYLAKAGLIGSFIGLISSIPLYYFFSIKGIVPAIIISSAITLLINTYFTNSLNIKPIYVSKVRTIAEGKGMLKMGFMISLSGLISLGASFIVRIFISKMGGVAQVGLYNAGFVIINTYVGMIFTAMGTDYYPRLSSASHSNMESKSVINQQAEIAILILAPIIVAFLVFIKLVVIIFYSAEFIPVSNMISYAALGMFFKAASWSIAFIFLAKGASKLFFWSELFTNLYLLSFNLFGYFLGGITGLGVSFLVSFILYLLQVFFIARSKYQFSFFASVYKIFCIQFSIALVCFIITKLSNPPYSYLVGVGLLFVSCLYSIYELNKRLQLKFIFISYYKRFIK